MFDEKNFSDRMKVILDELGVNNTNFKNNIPSEEYEKEMLDWILYKLNEINSFDDYGFTFVHRIAGYTRNLKLIDLIIKNNGNLNISDLQLGLTPLMYACMFNNEAMVKKLILNGANVNYIDDRGNSVLHYAAFNNHGEKIIEILDEYNIDKYITNKVGENALHFAVKINRPTENVRALLKIGLDGKQPDGYGYSPLYWTALYCNIRSMKAIIDAIGYPTSQEINTLFKILMDYSDKYFIAELQSSSGIIQ